MAGNLYRSEYIRRLKKTRELSEEPSVRTMRSLGPKVVAIGGGTGLSVLLRGLKRYTQHITAIVTVADDGGGSGVIRRELGMLPPGDIRNCILALANTEPVMSKVMNYRFSSGSLNGQNFGNLFLAALNGVYGSFEEAVERMNEVLAVSGRVLPVTTADINIEALFSDGSRVIGESKIAGHKKSGTRKIERIFLTPAAPEALPAALTAIGEADLIVLGPGSLYTSIIPNLLVKGVVPALAAASGLKIYVMNLMTQDGETEDMSAEQHVKALLYHAEDLRILDGCLMNTAPINEQIARRYEEEGAGPLASENPAAIEAMGIAVYKAPVAQTSGDFAHHDADALAKELLCLLLNERGAGDKWLSQFFQLFSQLTGRSC